jgi:hypothetical protein
VIKIKFFYLHFVRSWLQPNDDFVTPQQKVEKIELVTILFSINEENYCSLSQNFTQLNFCAGEPVFMQLEG